MRRKQHGPEVFRITGARQGLAEDVRGRQRRYVISMLVRTVAVLATVLLWNVQRPLAVVTLVLGTVLPYIAVVVANAGRENAPSLPSSYLTTPPRPALGPAEPEPSADSTAESPGQTPIRPAGPAPEEPSHSAPERRD